MTQLGTDPPKTPAVQLSRRELEVAQMVARGLTNRQIASALFISERTVDGHLEHVREKLGVNTRAQVAAWVVRRDAEAPTAESSATSTRTPTRGRLVVHPRLWVATALVLALIAAGVGVLRLTTPPPLLIETIAGSECHHQRYPGGCFGGDPDLAIHAYLSRPTGVAVDRNGVIYIADSGNGRVRQVAALVITTEAGSDSQVPLANGLLGTSVSLGDVSSVGVDRDGRPLFLSDADGTVSVWKVMPGGFLARVVGLPSGPTSGPRGPGMPLGGLAVAQDGTLFIADRDGNRVWRYASGQVSPYAGTGTFGFSENGTATGSDLAWPIGLALDGAGDVFIADAGNNRIRKVDPQGRISTIAGCCEIDGYSGDGGRAVRAELRFPYGVAVGPDGSIVVADTGNHRLRRISTDGFIYPLAGTGAWGFNGDGPVLQTTLSGPEGIAFDAKGNLFIADTENQRVREIEAPSTPK